MRRGVCGQKRLLRISQSSGVMKSGQPFSFFVLHNAAAWSPLDTKDYMRESDTEMQAAFGEPRTITKVR